ncbi:MAG: hypothetical protein LBW77_05925 [Verrucomicrobiota bacterium]|nr:hypothetical protein [Verrucomicrobiota bacterium]
MKTTDMTHADNTVALFLMPVSLILISATFFVCIVGGVVVGCFIPFSAGCSEFPPFPAVSVWVRQWMPLSLLGPVLFAVTLAVMRVRKPSVSKMIRFFATIIIFDLCVWFLCAFAIALSCLQKFGQS